MDGTPFILHYTVIVLIMHHNALWTQASKKVCFIIIFQ